MSTISSVSAQNTALLPTVDSDGATVSYQIEHGDTLSAIAEHFGVSLSSLLAANPQVLNPDVIYPGDAIQIPAVSNNPIQSSVSPTGTLSTSEQGLDLIKGFEGLRLTSYQDSAGVWTIGYGHTEGVRPGQTISQAQADNFFRSDVAWAEQAVRNNVSVPLNQGQFDAVVNITFNVGAGALESSTLLRKLNAGDYAGAREEFGRWVHAGGESLEGLVRRRAEEAELFGSRAPTEPPVTPPIEHPIPSPAPASNYLVQPGDLLGSIAQRSGISLSSLLAANPQIANPNLIYPGQQILIPGDSAPSSHMVRHGDTLGGIASRHGVSLSALLAANRQIDNPDLIFPGQQITLPPIVREPATG